MMIAYAAHAWGFLENVVPYASLFLGSFACVLFGTPLCRALARRFGLVDLPSARRIHATPIPRGGGLTIYLALALTLVVAMDVFGLALVPSAYVLHRFLVLGGVLCVVGLLDDKFSLPPWVKLAGQVAVAAATYVWIGNGYFRSALAVPVWLDFALTVFWIVGAINAFNLIDGLDGLATGLAAIASIGLIGTMLFTRSAEGTLVYIAFLGACLGFLRHNFHPATIFLGDTGSMFLGYFLATMPLLAGGVKSLFVSLGVPLLSLGVPIFDTALAIVRRMIRSYLNRFADASAGNGHVMTADTDHLHHRILRRFASQRKTALGLYALAAGLVALALCGVALKGRALALFAVGFMSVSIVLIRDMRRIELWDAGRLLDVLAHDRSHGPRRRWHLLRIPLTLVADWAVLIVSWIAVVVFLDFPITEMALRRWMLLRTVPIFLCLVFFRTYATLWSRAQLSNYVRLAVCVLIGSLVTIVTVETLMATPHRHLYLFTWLYGSLVVSGLVGVRMIRAIARDLFYALDSGRLAESTSSGTIRTVVYGTGLRYRAFRRELVRAAGSQDRRRVIVGLLDDDVLLRNLYIGGLKIHGTLKQAPEILKRLRADEVVIACRMTDAHRAIARQIFSTCGVAVTEWTQLERPFPLDDATATEQGH